MVHTVRVLNSFTSVGSGSPVGHGTKFTPGKNRLGAKVLTSAVRATISSGPDN
jgi:hypothetical protein